MGYSSKATLLAAVDSLGEVDGLSTLDDKLSSWRFTEKCAKTNTVRNIAKEREWLKSERKKLRRVK